MSKWAAWINLSWTDYFLKLLKQTICKIITKHNSRWLCFSIGVVLLDLSQGPHLCDRHFTVKSRLPDTSYTSSSAQQRANFFPHTGDLWHLYMCSACCLYDRFPCIFISTYGAAKWSLSACCRRWGSSLLVFSVGSSQTPRICLYMCVFVKAWWCWNNF